MHGIRAATLWVLAKTGPYVDTAGSAGMPVDITCGMHVGRLGCYQAAYEIVHMHPEPSWYTRRLHTHALPTGPTHIAQCSVTAGRRCPERKPCSAKHWRQRPLQCQY